MPEIILCEEEGIDEALKRFKRIVGKNEILKIVKNIHFEGATTKGQRRRAKTKKAVQRWRRLLRKKAEAHSADRFDQCDKLKTRLMASDATRADSPVGGALYNDTSWTVEDDPEAWRPNLAPVKLPKKVSEQPERDGGRGHYHQTVSRFGEDQRLEDEDELPPSPSVHVCVIAAYEMRQSGKKYRGIVVVRGTDYDEEKKIPVSRTNFQFPGGGVEIEKGENCEQAASREYLEETGLILAPLSEKDDRIYTVEVGSHTFICYAGKIVSGTPKKGTEIVDMKLPSLKQLKDWAERGILSSNHRDSFQKYLELEVVLASNNVAPEKHKSISKAKVARGGASV